MQPNQPFSPELDSNVVFECGIHLCAGCCTVCTGQKYCLRCRQEIAGLDNQVEPMSDEEVQQERYTPLYGAGVALFATAVTSSLLIYILQLIKAVL